MISQSDIKINPKSNVIFYKNDGNEQEEKHNDKKTEYKASLVARGLQETVKPQSDSLTVSKESFKLLMVVVVNNNFELASLDTQAAFLQAKVFDREIYMKPPEDIWKLGFL